MTIFFIFFRNNTKASNKFLNTLDKKFKECFTEIIIIFPNWSIIFIHEKLNDNEAAGINSIVKNINEPISPIIEDRDVRVELPKIPPKLFSK